MGVKNNFLFIFKYLKLNLKKEAQYKSSFVLQIIMMILNDLFFILQWIIVFSLTDSIGGYGFREVLVLWGLSAGSYGISHLFFYGAFNIGDFIYNGKLDVFLTQPKNILINVCCSSTSVAAIGDIFYCFIVFAIAGVTWWWYLAAIPIIIIGGIIFAALIVCYQTLAFYVKKGNAFADMVASSITLFSTYPPVIFDIVSKVFLYTIIPCGFMVFVPMQYIFLSFNIWWVLAMVGVAVVLVVLAFLLFKIGLKRYASGNLMGGRI